MDQSMMIIEKAGLFTTVQDLGRFGYKKMGVVQSGVMDPIAAKVANLLVGNDEQDAVLEFTLQGGRIAFPDGAWIAITGGKAPVQYGGKEVSMWKAIWIEPDQYVEIGMCQEGCRIYLAIAGGIQVSKVLNSRSTYIRGQMGGFCGRPIKRGDVLLIKKQSQGQLQKSSWKVSPRFTGYMRSNPVQIIPSSEWDQFTLSSQKTIQEAEYLVTPQSDRMGLRLAGPFLETIVTKEQRMSEAVTLGTVQIPPNGQPIILMNDCQTVGGYPVIGSVATVDLPVLAQKRPGEKIKFFLITLEEAQLALRKLRTELRQLEREIKN